MGFLLRPCLAAVALLFLLSFSAATKVVIVGGNTNSVWQIPPPSSPDYYNRWAQSKRFRIGDSVVFKYDGKTDSVVRVTEEGYDSCDTSKAAQSYTDGNTEIALDRSGHFYFISGAQGHCEKGQKVAITVQSVKGKPGKNPEAPAPSPEDAHDHYAPAPAPKKNGAGKAGFAGGLAAAACAVLAFVV